MTPQPEPALPAPWTFRRPQVAACPSNPGEDLARTQTRGSLGGSLGFVRGLAGCWGAVAEAEVRVAPQCTRPAWVPAGAPGV